MWPFNKSKNNNKELRTDQNTDLPKKPPITLQASDDSIKRAVNILEVSGIVVSNTVYSQIVPWMAHAIRSYQDLDRAAFENEKNEQKTG